MKYIGFILLLLLCPIIAATERPINRTSRLEEKLLPRATILRQLWTCYKSSGRSQRDLDLYTDIYIQVFMIFNYYGGLVEEPLPSDILKNKECLIPREADQDLTGMEVSEYHRMCQDICEDITNHWKVYKSIGIQPHLLASISKRLVEIMQSEGKLKLHS